MKCKSKCIYLSPSSQQFNLYNGPGNEEEYMNLVADSVAKYLTQSGICYTRNSPDMTVGEIVGSSNSGDYILHLAIHSNAASEMYSGEIRGSEVYYFPTSENGRLLAEIIVKNMKSIYPLPDSVTTKTSTSFGELRRTKAPSVLVEVAYHDNTEDAEWIRQNTDEIGRILALSVKEYIEEICSCDNTASGEVITMGGNLNVRSEPNINSSVIGKLSNGSTVTIDGCTDKWYKITHNGTEGYVSKKYVAI